MDPPPPTPPHHAQRRVEGGEMTVIPGWREAPDPESILTVVVTDSRFARFTRTPE
jgi:hypothetical protein